MQSRLRLLWTFMADNRWRYVAAFGLVAVATALSYAGPLVLRVTIDSVIGTNPLHAPEILSSAFQRIGGRDALLGSLWVCGAIFVLLTGLNGVASFLYGQLVAAASESTAKRIRDTLYDHHVKAETGDLIQRSTSDVETVRRFLALQLIEVGRAAFLLGLAVPLLLSLNARLGLTAIAVVPIILVSSFLFFSWVRKLFARSDAAEGRLATTLQENLIGVRVVRAFGRQAFELRKFDERNREYRDLTYRLVKLLAGYWSASDTSCA